MPHRRERAGPAYGPSTEAAEDEVRQRTRTSGTSSVAGFALSSSEVRAYGLLTAHDAQHIGGNQALTGFRMPCRVIGIPRPCVGLSATSCRRVPRSLPAVRRRRRNVGGDQRRCRAKGDARRTTTQSSQVTRFQRLAGVQASDVGSRFFGHCRMLFLSGAIGAETVMVEPASWPFCCQHPITRCNPDGRGWSPDSDWR